MSWPFFFSFIFFIIQPDIFATIQQTPSLTGAREEVEQIYDVLQEVSPVYTGTALPLRLRGLRLKSCLHISAAVLFFHIFFFFSCSFSPLPLHLTQTGPFQKGEIQASDTAPASILQRFFNNAFKWYIPYVRIRILLKDELSRKESEQRLFWD